MTPAVVFLLTLAALPLILASFLARPRLMCACALLACVLPFLLPTSEPFLRAAAALLTWAFTVIVMLTTGTMLVRGAHGIDPSDAWSRCCR